MASPALAVATPSTNFWTGRVLRYLAATGISLYGDWLTTFALVVLLFRSTGTATAPAIYMLARVAPRVVGPTPGGVLTDRWGPVRLATLCLLVQAALTAAIVVVGDKGVLWAIYPLVAAGQFANAASQPAFAAMPPRLATPEHLGRLNGLYGGILGSSIMVSPAIGALLLPHTTPEVLITADAATFIVGAILVASLGARSAPPQAAPGGGGARAGWRVVARDATLRSAAAAAFGNAAAVTALQAVLVVAATEHFHRDVDVGWLYSAVGAGGLLAGLMFLRRNPRHIRRRTIVILAIGEVAPLAVFVGVLNIGTAVALLFLSSFAAVTYQVLSAIAMQQRVPLALLGRANGARRQALYMGAFVGAVAAVVLVRPIGWEATVLAVCALAVLVLAAFTLTGPRDRAAALLDATDVSASPEQDASAAPPWPAGEIARAEAAREASTAAAAPPAPLG